MHMASTVPDAPWTPGGICSLSRMKGMFVWPSHLLSVQGTGGGPGVQYSRTLHIVNVMEPHQMNLESGTRTGSLMDFWPERMPCSVFSPRLLLYVISYHNPIVST